MLTSMFFVKPELIPVTFINVLIVDPFAMLKVLNVVCVIVFSLIGIVTFIVSVESPNPAGNLYTAILSVYITSAASPTIPKNV